MSFGLQDPFRNECPEVVETVLEDGFGTTCAFNRWGTLLAVGCHDGRIVIWDFDTRSPAKSLAGHTHPVTAVSWSFNGRKLASSSADRTVVLWDVLSGSVDIAITFDSVVWSVQIHPRDATILLAWALYEVTPFFMVQMVIFIV